VDYLAAAEAISTHSPSGRTLMQQSLDREAAGVGFRACARAKCIVRQRCPVSLIPLPVLPANAAARWMSSACPCCLLPCWSTSGHAAAPRCVAWQPIERAAAPPLFFLSLVEGCSLALKLYPAFLASCFPVCRGVCDDASTMRRRL